ncbi:MAG: hypothetical protein IPN62_11775 [Flavobacteriales bacterium]|nr:hypothetical protein [Flavobacteriales bacterium]
MAPLTGAHEFGHLFGLSDRYHEIVNYTSNQDQLNGNPRSTVPMVIPDPSVDTQYDPLNNLYSAGQPLLTDMQLGIVFGNANEPNYPTVVAINSASATYQMIQVIESGGKPQVTSFERNRQGVDKVGSTNVNWARPQGNGFQTNGQISERALAPNSRLSRNPAANQLLIQQRYLGR